MDPTIVTERTRTYSTHKEYTVDFFGDALYVTVTPDFSVINQWISDVFRNRNHCGLVVGVGVQWTPPALNVANPSDCCWKYIFDNMMALANYAADPLPGDYVATNTNQRGEFISDPPADTLQLCVGNKCLIIQLRCCDEVPNSLRSFLTDPERTFVGVCNSQDARKLARSSHELEIGELVDVMQHVNDSRGMSMEISSFEEIVEECMGYQGVRLDPDISMSDWTVYDLYDDQILQASLVAYVCHELGVRARLWQVGKQVSNKN
ncbi:PREDICTED: uncharacterized protein LOC104748154 [Camelina sativa]|uniref:Uncharacterized protein LOC104748154 n=1 Tax=Camelina sativa TaxID=90675 RepID=A0ABM0WAL3_CAMSA|nr:PREDICTED: uncharacterized protein LOC104748154 [Camelina sativa]